MKRANLRGRTALHLARPVLIVAAVATVLWVNAGDLFPPTGAIAPTNRVQLSDQVTTLPFTITSPGSYMLTSSLTGSSGLDGVIIDADNVTLDLNGFSLIGVAGSLDGVRINGVHTNIAIHDGMIVGWGGVGLNAGGPAEHLRITNLSANDNSSHGLVLGSNSYIAELSVRNNGGTGIRVVGQGNRIDECHMTGNDTGLEVVGTDNLIVRNSAWDNATADFNIASGNAFGPIVNVGGIGDISVVFNADHPWANFAVTCNPVPEVCDGLDNDCNGIIDDGIAPTCYSGPQGSEGVGVCMSGTQACVNGVLGPCVGEVLPTAEICDGQDNDCDGITDEGNPDSGNACSTGLPGVCAGGTTNCVSGTLICVQTTQPSAEVCDGLDNDCDGITDEGCAPNGTPCTASSQCASSFCVDGFCCNTACTTLCTACGIAGMEGTCAAVPVGQDPRHDCPGTDFCISAGQCCGSTGQPCSSGSECCSGGCTFGICQ